MSQKPYVWQMVKEAVGFYTGVVTYAQIRDYIKGKYGDVNESTIGCQILVCSVNHQSRIHYTDNKKPRITTSGSQYDFLYTIGRGQVELYDPEKHGVWEISQDDFGKLVVRQVLQESEELEEVYVTESNYCFALESHLRDFLANNLDEIAIQGKKLQLYLDENSRDGIEYPTDVGPIDILTQDDSGNFVVFELKLKNGPDRAIGQILRYMGWVNAHLAKGKQVRGVLVASSIDNKFRYAISLVPNIDVYEYKVDFKLEPARLKIESE